MSDNYCVYNVVGTDEKPKGIGIRHVQVALLFFVLLVGYAMRSAMGVAILAMSDVTNHAQNAEVYIWDKRTQDIVLSSFYWGYTLMQVPAGMLALRYGGWFLLTIAMMVNGVASLMTPMASHFGGWQAVCALRMIQGVTQGSMYPSMHTLIGKWIPLSERGRLGYFAYCGSTIGTVLSMPLAGFLSTSAAGWPSIFYVCGCMSLIAGFLWHFLGANAPGEHKKITLQEREFIELELNLTTGEKQHQDYRTPWADIVTSIPMIALTISHIGCNWSFMTMLMETPSYLKNILGIDIQQSGLLSGLPYLVMWLIGFLGSFVNDYLINERIFSVSTTRKLMNTFGLWMPAIFMIVLTYLPKDNTISAITVVTLIIGLSGTTTVGFMMNHMDLSPNYAGILMAISNSTASLIGIWAPITVGMVLNGHETDPLRWRTIFWASAGVSFVSNLIFIIFGSGKVQTWNRSRSHEDLEQELREEVQMMSLRKKSILSDK